MARIPKAQAEMMRRKGCVPTAEAALPLGVSRGHIARLAATGRVTSQRIGGVVYVNLRSLVQYMGEHGAKLLAPLIRKVESSR